MRACLDETALLHRHLCPRQVLGVRLGLYAGELLGVELPRRDKRLYVFAETDGCVTDAISVATGCWLGHRTLRLIDHGKVAATVVDTSDGGAIRVWPHPAARSRAAAYAPEARDRWHQQLEGYLAMPAAELLCWARVRLAVDLDALRSRPGRRVSCGACGEEIINEREVLVAGVPWCRSCAGEPYFTMADRASS
ncbi:MAG TPA: FmdE family protein [Candidatus Limnocylindria bacterium]|nr:FmdE family protein [Candidatus Limnocylindria bacterium]